MLRTTIFLREDIYEAIVQEFGKRKLSEAINGYLVEHMFKEKKKDMFGADKWLQKAGTKDLRDHYEHDL